jgi:DNA repair exonuclease SbcCD ATPase subunit
LVRNEIVAFCAPIRYTLVQGGFLMKKRLVVLFAIALCLLATVTSKSAWAADPGSRYADAFVLIEQGQAAEEKSDLATAYRNYQSALSTLHSIRTDSPDWNAQMVEYRLKDCQTRFDAVKTKLPEPPPALASAASITPAVTPVVEAPAAPTAPVVTPPAPPPAPVVKSAVVDQSPKLKSEIDKLEAENRQLKSDLTDAKRAAKSSSQADALTKENKDLKAQLAAAEKKATAKPAPKAPAEPSQNFQQGSSTVIASPVVAAPSSDSAEMKKLRAELNKTRAEADAAKKSAAQVPDLQKQNKDLNAQLAAAEKKAAAAKLVTPAPAPTDTTELKKLRSDLADARAEADKSRKASAQAAELEKQNKDLSARLATAEKKASAPTVDPTELKKLRAEADSAHTDADKARKSAADLEKKNSDLSAQLASAKKEPAAKPVVPAESPELKKARADLDAARSDALAQAKKNAAQLSDLEKQNKDLSAKLASSEKKTNIAPTDSSEVKNLRTELDKSHAEVADLKKQAAAKPVVAPVPVADSGEVKGLRTQLADTRKELDQAKKSANQVSDLEKQNKDLSAKLAAADKKASTAAAKPAPVDNSAELKKLHEELDASRTEADKGKKASAQVADLQKQNKDLSAKLAEEKKAEAEAPAVAPDVRVMKQLRNENSYLRNLLDTYAEQNSELKGQLRRHDQNQSKSSQ